MEEPDLKINDELCISRFLRKVHGDRFYNREGHVEKVTQTEVWIKFKVYHPVRGEEIDFSVEGKIPDVSVNGSSCDDLSKLLQPGRSVLFCAKNNIGADELPTPWKVTGIYARQVQKFETVNSIMEYLKQFEFIDSCGCDCNKLILELVKSMNKSAFLDWAYLHKKAVISAFNELSSKEDDKFGTLPLDDDNLYFSNIAHFVFDRYDNA